MENGKLLTAPSAEKLCGGLFFVGVAPAVLNGRRSEAPLWEIGVAYDRKSQQVGLIGTAPEKLSYQVVADYDSYQAIPRIAPPIKGVARLLKNNG